jgi:hypothetical protein
MNATSISNLSEIEKKLLLALVDAAAAGGAGTIDVSAVARGVGIADDACLIRLRESLRRLRATRTLMISSSLSQTAKNPE